LNDFRLIDYFNLEFFPKDFYSGEREKYGVHPVFSPLIAMHKITISQLPFLSIYPGEEIVSKIF